MAGDGRTLLQARLVDLETALGTLGDSELKGWPDKGFVVMVRMPRNTAREQVIELRGVLAGGQNADSQLRRLVDSLVQVRDLIRERVPVQGEKGHSRR